MKRDRTHVSSSSCNPSLPPGRRRERSGKGGVGSAMHHPEQDSPLIFSPSSSPPPGPYPACLAAAAAAAAAHAHAHFLFFLSEKRVG